MEMHPEEEAPAAPSETRQRASAANAALARFAAQQQQVRPLLPWRAPETCFGTKKMAASTFREDVQFL